MDAGIQVYDVMSDRPIVLMVPNPKHIDIRSALDGYVGLNDDMRNAGIKQQSVYLGGPIGGFIITR